MSPKVLARLIALLAIALAAVGLSALVGWLALVVLLRVVDRGQLHRFAPYCWILGAITLVIAWMG